MDRFEAMRIFVRVAELKSFTKASEDIGLPKSGISNYIQNLEKNVNAKLLNRTTRVVNLTPEGMLFYERCKNILSDIDEVESMFAKDSNLKGKIRIDMTVKTATSLLIPLLTNFFEKHPDLEIELSSLDRKIDLIKEGVDCVIRAGNSNEVGIVEKKLGELHQINCVSPDYLKKYGNPKTLDDLNNHKLIFYSPLLDGKTTGFEYFKSGKEYDLKMKGNITVNNTNAYLISCLNGLGIAQLPHISCRDYLKKGELVEILPDFRAKPLNINVVYPYRSIQSKRVRAFIDWISPIIIEYIKD